MYFAFYGLKEKPFSLAASTKYLYLGERHQEALTLLGYGLAEDKGICLLTGMTGTGKSTLTRHLLQTSPMLRQSQIVLVNNPMTLGDDLARFLVQELRVEEPEQPSASRSYHLLEQHLGRLRLSRKRVLLAIDEAQCLGDDMLEQVRLLTNIQRDQEVLLQVLLVGQSSLRQRLRTPRFKAFVQRLGVACTLKPFTMKESVGYVLHRLKVAGAAKPETLFTKDALKLAHRASGGVPRVLNQICDTALTYGFAEEAKVIGEGLVLEVARDRRRSGLPVGRECREILGQAAE
jgi:general secretion pathway protein A